MTDGGITARLKELMGTSRRAAFARKCGIPDSSMRQYLEGSIPGADKAAQIAERAGVSLLWLITGEGPKYSVDADKPADFGGFSEPQAPYAVGPDPELLGRIVDAVARVYRDERVRLPDVDLGRVAAERYAEVAAMATDPEEWPALLDLVAVRVRRAIRAAASDPTATKREA